MGRKGINLGKLFGITIRIDWSWLVIFVLVVLDMHAVFGQAHPDWIVAYNWGLALLAAALFFLSVLAHELAHSVVAKGRGIPVRSITLFLFGGVSNIQRDPDSPRSEFLITVVGPLTSILLGVIFGILAGIQVGSIQSMTAPANLLDHLGAAGTLFLLLSSVNFALGIFNLIPGFPLDGGRLLRSFLWSLNDDLTGATRWAAGIGQAVAWLLIVSGIAMVFGVTIPFFGSGPFNGLWLAFIGWFLNTASARSYRQVVIEDVLENVPVSRLMHDVTASVEPTLTLEQLVNDRFMATDARSLPVVAAGRIVGIVTLEDVRKVRQDNWRTTTVREVMTPQDALETVSPDDEATDALHRLASRDVRLLPVQKDGQLIGLLRRRDIVKWLQLHSQFHHV